MNPDEIRAFADATTPRVLEDGWTINARHVAIESTLRGQHGHPGFIGHLDGPGRYRGVGNLAFAPGVLEALKLAHAIEPDPLFTRLARVAEQLDPGGRYECPVEGCGWAFDVPQPHLTQTDNPLTISWVGASRSKVEAVIVKHLDEHASNGAPPVLEPPEWPEVEWCDGGGSCEHDACLDQLVADEDDEPDGWRIP